MSPRLADVPCPAQLAGSDATRDRALDARAPRVERGELARLPALAGGLQRLVLRPRAHREGPAHVRLLGADAFVAVGAATTVARGELDLDHVVAPAVHCWGPTDARAPLRAGGLLGRPVDPEVLGAVALA